MKTGEKVLKITFQARFAQCFLRFPYFLRLLRDLFSFLHPLFKAQQTSDRAIPYYIDLFHQAVCGTIAYILGKGRNKNMLNCLVVGVGGFIGSVLRYLIGLIHIEESCVFPVKTFAVNVIGAFAIGIITAFALKNVELNPRLVLFLKVGVCGGFTTFSTFALESAKLFQDGRGVIAVLYIFFSTVLSILAVLAAEALVK